MYKLKLTGHFLIICLTIINSSCYGENPDTLFYHFDSSITLKMSETGYISIADGPDIGITACQILDDSSLLLLNGSMRSIDWIKFDTKEIQRIQLDYSELEYRGTPTDMLWHNEHLIIVDDLGGVLVLDEGLNQIRSFQIVNAQELFIIDLNDVKYVIKNYQPDAPHYYSLELISLESLVSGALPEVLLINVDYFWFHSWIRTYRCKGISVDIRKNILYNEIRFIKSNTGMIIEGDIPIIKEYDAYNIDYNENMLYMFFYQSDLLVIQKWLRE